MLPNFLLEFTAVILVATLLGILFRKLKQPTILAFIITGIILGSSFLNVITFKELLQTFSDFGIAFLLFLVGLNLDMGVIKDIGKASIITGIGQIVFTATIGLLIAFVLGFGIIEALYIAIALTFSSTIIIVKLLSDKKELNALYGKIAVGFLLVQDFVAIAILVLLSVVGVSNNYFTQFFQFVANVLILFLVFFISYKFLVKRMFDSFSKSQELLFLGSISWCFVFTAFAIFMGFSKEIGAFLAGVSIASLPYTHEVFGKLKYLRDFFIVLFFVVLGSSLVFASGEVVVLPAIIFSIFVLVGNPIIVFLLMAKLGYKGRTSFLSSLAVAQISEFSLIIIFLGERLGHISSGVVSIITLVAVATISVSTYMIVYNHQLYAHISKFLPILRTKGFFEDSLHKTNGKDYQAVCIGFGETGKSIFASSEINREDLLVVDFDPRALKEASSMKFNTFYGDAASLETVDFITACNPKIVVSTIMDPELNILISKKFPKKSRLNLIVLTHSISDARKLRSAGVGFVVVPSLAAARRVRAILEDIQKGRNFELQWLKEMEFG